MYERREREGEFLRGAESFHRSPNRSDKAVYSCETGNPLRNTEDIKQFNMMEVVLTRLRDFSCKTSTFDENKQEEQDGCRDPHRLRGGCTAGGGGSRLDIESALAWLRMELMEMRSQDQALIRQLMELHAGIQELKQELSEEEEEENEDTDEEEEEEEEEEGSYWDSGSEEGSGSFCSTSGRMVVSFYYQKTPRGLHSREKVLSRRSSVP